MAAAGIALAALTLSGATAGIVIVGLVAVLAVARSVSSVSYKDVLGKTVEKARRGRVSGNAASIAAAGVLVFGALLLTGWVDRVVVVSGAIGLSAVLWLMAAGVFTRLRETPSEPAHVEQTSTVRRYWQYLRTDRELQKLIVARGLLMATAIAPPYLILLASDATGSMFTQLGLLVVAAALAAFVSGWVWGIFSDRSTPLAMASAGILAAFTLLVAIAAAAAGWFAHLFVLPALLLVLMVAYQGVRIGRTTQLVNIANEDTRTAYTALSNTIIGIALLLTGGLGFLVPLLGIGFVLWTLVGMCLLGAAVASRMQA